MNPQDAFCPNLECPARGQRGRDNIRVHSRMEQRYQCNVCERTFCARAGTVFYRLRTPPETVLMVLALLVYGCPLQAIVKVFGFDERTVKSWWQRAGTHCESVHEQLIGQAQLDLGQVQADEIKVKAQGQSLWMALALMVPTRLWLGGALSHRRDQALIERLVAQVRAVALHRPLLLAVDGFASYVSAFEAAFRTKLPRFGQRGRCQWRAWSDISIVQVVKRRAVGGLQIERRVVRGCLSEVERLLSASQGGGTINTAFIERLNATFRQRLSWLTRRTRTLAQQPKTLQAGMFFLGCVYNWCDLHQSLRVRLWVGRHGYRWVGRTPAMATGLTDHPWSLQELLTFQVPPPRWVPPRRRGRRSKDLQHLIQKWAA
jgi:transposase-like protein